MCFLDGEMGVLDDIRRGFERLRISSKKKDQQSLIEAFKGLLYSKLRPKVRF